MDVSTAIASREAARRPATGLGTTAIAWSADDRCPATLVRPMNGSDRSRVSCISASARSAVARVMTAMSTSTRSNSIVIDRSGRMKDTVLPRIEFLNAGGDGLFRVVGLDGLEKFDQGTSPGSRARRCRKVLPDRRRHRRRFLITTRAHCRYKRRATQRRMSPLNCAGRGSPSVGVASSTPCGRPWASSTSSPMIFICICAAVRSPPGTRDRARMTVRLN